MNLMYKLKCNSRIATVKITVDNFLKWKFFQNIVTIKTNSHNNVLLYLTYTVKQYCKFT